MQAARDFIASSASSHAQDPLGQEYQEIAALYEKKLWHQLTNKLEQFVQNPAFSSGAGIKESVDLYHHFLKDFSGRINQMSFVKIVLVIAHNIAQSGEGAAAVDFLQKIGEGINSEREREAHILVQAELAFLKLAYLHATEESKALADSIGHTLEQLTGADPFVYSAYYRYLSTYYKQQVSATNFFKNTLLYLVYTPLEQIPLEEQRIIAFDLGMTALVSPEIHNFGELLAHPILKSLVGTPQNWLVEFLFAFNAGEIDRFSAYLTQYQNEINAQPIIKSNLPLLREKISILALMELVFNKPSEERTIPFEVIAQVTKLNVDAVELLVMKAMSLKLIKGVIDGVNNTVTVSWVQTRVLDLKQIGKMRDTLNRWNYRVKEVLTLMQNETGPEILKS